MKEKELLEKNSKIVLLPINELKHYEKNNKHHTEEQINTLARMIAEWKKVDPIRITKDKIIISGHARVLALEKLGYTQAPCIIDDDLDDNQSRALRIAHNKIADQAYYIDENLAFDILELNKINFDLSLLGLDEFEIKKFLNFDELENEFRKKAEEEFSKEENKNYVLKVIFEDHESLSKLFNELKDRGFVCEIE